MPGVPATTLAHLIALLSLLLSGSLARGDASTADSPAQRQTAMAPADTVTSQTQVPDPAGSDSSVIERVDTTQHARRTRLVYACRDAATPVFSDRPCGASADAWRLDLPPTFDSGAAPTTRAAAPAAATRPIAVRATRRDAVGPPDPCARLEVQLAAIDARMRNGYSAREAARLWQRWRDAKAKLRAGRC